MSLSRSVIFPSRSTGKGLDQNSRNLTWNFWVRQLAGLDLHKTPELCAMLHLLQIFNHWHWISLEGFSKKTKQTLQTVVLSSFKLKLQLNLGTFDWVDEKKCFHTSWCVGLRVFIWHWQFQKETSTLLKQQRLVLCCCFFGTHVKATGIGIITRISLTNQSRFSKIHPVAVFLLGQKKFSSMLLISVFEIIIYLLIHRLELKSRNIWKVCTSTFLQCLWSTVLSVSTVRNAVE